MQQHADKDERFFRRRRAILRLPLCSSGSLEAAPAGSERPWAAALPHQRLFSNAIQSTPILPLQRSPGCARRGTVLRGLCDANPRAYGVVIRRSCPTSTRLGLPKVFGCFIPLYAGAVAPLNKDPRTAHDASSEGGGRPSILAMVWLRPPPWVQSEVVTPIGLLLILLMAKFGRLGKSQTQLNFRGLGSLPSAA